MALSIAEEGTPCTEKSCTRVVYAATPLSSLCISQRYKPANSRISVLIALWGFPLMAALLIYLGSIDCLRVLKASGGSSSTKVAGCHITITRRRMKRYGSDQTDSSSHWEYYR